MAALPAAALNETVTVTENGKREVTKRAAVIAQMVNKSASADLRATKMLIDMLRNLEKRAELLSTAKSPFGPTDKEVVQQLVARLRRNMCGGCRRAGRLDGPAQNGRRVTDRRLNSSGFHPSFQPPGYAWAGPSPLSPGVVRGAPRLHCGHRGRVKAWIVW